MNTLERRQEFLEGQHVNPHRDYVPAELVKIEAKLAVLAVEAAEAQDHERDEAKKKRERMLLLEKEFAGMTEAECLGALHAHDEKLTVEGQVPGEEGTLWGEAEMDEVCHFYKAGLRSHSAVYALALELGRKGSSIRWLFSQLDSLVGARQVRIDVWERLMEAWDRTRKAHGHTNA